MQIETIYGTKTIRIERMMPLDGWEIKSQFKSFANSQDTNFRQAYVMRVLSYAFVVIGNNEFPMRTPAMIENHIGTVENISEVFDSVLSENGIDSASCANETDYNTAVGGAIGASFIAECMDALGIFVAHLVKEGEDV